MNFTPTERALMEVISDGKPHELEELRELIDELSEKQAVYFHMCNLRKKLERIGQSIVMVRKRKISYYQLIRILATPYE
jgi:predicted Zn-ribbon and HTH transcriptional regulator